MTQQLTPGYVFRKKQKNTNSKMFIAALFTVAKIWKQPMCLSTEE